MANQNQRQSESRKGRMTVEEAGQKGGSRVRDLVNEGKEHEQEGRGRKERYNEKNEW